MPITTLSFDGDMTLWDFNAAMRKALVLALEKLRSHVSTQATMDLTVDEMVEIRDQVAESVAGQALNLESIRRVAFERTLEKIGCRDDALVAELHQLYIKHRFEAIRLYDDVPSMFDVLSPHFKIGLLSNGNTYPERCGLESYFEFAVFSQDVGVEKPDKQIFELTAERAGCRLDELLHIGDSLVTDVAGANGAGVLSVWLNRDGAVNNTGTEANFEITTLAELPAVLDGLHSP